VAVGQQNQIHAFQCGQFVVALVEAWIGQPGIDQQNVAGRRDQFKCGMSVPGELSVRHAEDEIENGLFGKRNGESNECEIGMLRVSAFCIRHSSFGLRHLRLSA